MHQIAAGHRCRSQGDKSSTGVAGRYASASDAAHPWLSLTSRRSLVRAQYRPPLQTGCKSTSLPATASITNWPWSRRLGCTRGARRSGGRTRTRGGQHRSASKERISPPVSARTAESGRAGSKMRRAAIDLGLAGRARLGTTAALRLKQSPVGRGSSRCRAVASSRSANIPPSPGEAGGRSGRERVLPTRPTEQ